MTEVSTGEETGRGWNGVDVPRSFPKVVEGGGRGLFLVLPSTYS